MMDVRGVMASMVATFSLFATAVVCTAIFGTLLVGPLILSYVRNDWYHLMLYPFTLYAAIKLHHDLEMQ